MIPLLSAIAREANGLKRNYSAKHYGKIPRISRWPEEGHLKPSRRRDG